MKVLIGLITLLSLSNTAFGTVSRVRLSIGATYEMRNDNNSQYALFNEETSVTDDTKTSTTGFSGVGSVGYLMQNFGARLNIGRSGQLPISGTATYRGAGTLATINGYAEETFYGGDVFFVAERFSIVFMFGVGLEQHQVVVNSHIDTKMLFNDTDLNMKGDANMLKYFIGGDYYFTHNLALSIEVGVRSGQVDEFHLTSNADFGKGFLAASPGDILYKVNGPGNKLTGSTVTMDLSNKYGMVSLVYGF